MNGLSNIPWLSVLFFLPIVGALASLAWGRRVAVVTVLLEATVALLLPIQMESRFSPWIRFEDWAWIERYGARLTLGLDGLSLLLVWLTVILLAVAVGLSWSRYRQSGFYALLLTSCSGILGVFLAQDLLLFYVCWEIMLLPLILCIALWGGAKRVEAAFKLLLFTLAGSLLMLLALLGLFLLHGRQTGDYIFALQALRTTVIPPDLAPWLFGCLALAFLVKVPVVPLHGWLPDAYQEAPAAVTLLLSGVLAKAGIFGLVRVALPLFPETWPSFVPVLGVLALVSIGYGGWLAFVQNDLKRLVAYVSVAHLGFIALGVAAFNAMALQGAMLQLFNHGITTAALFVLVALVERRTGSRQLPELGGLWSRTPQLGAMLLFFSLATLGLPGLNIFTGEILILLGSFAAHPWWGVAGMFGVLLAACYTLRMTQGVLWGVPRGPDIMKDLNRGETLLLAPLVGLVLWFGLYPLPFLRLLRGPVEQLLARLVTTGGLP
ncbi:MAG: NuoM family protein [Pedobacter sp.]